MYMYVYVCIHINIYIYTYIYIQSYEPTHVDMQKYMHNHTYVRRLCIHVCIYAHIHVEMYMCTKDTPFFFWNVYVCVSMLNMFA